MEKFAKPYDKEFLKMAMLKHEETFKEQVHELHRLYRIQKILMKNIGNKRQSSTQSQHQELFNTKNSINFAQKSIMKLDLERTSADQNYAAETTGDRHRTPLEIIDESEIELTLGPSSYKKSRNKKKSETPLTSDSGPSSLSSSSTGSSHINKNATSSLIHQNMNKKSDDSGLRLFQAPEMTLSNSYQNENKINVDENLRQERLKQSPWLIQVLSLNMT